MARSVQDALFTGSEKNEIMLDICWTWYCIR
jgi:hypothetical protein